MQFSDNELFSIESTLSNNERYDLAYNTEKKTDSCCNLGEQSLESGDGPVTKTSTAASMVTIYQHTWMA